jgi:predicted nucleic acid-binding protein
MHGEDEPVVVNTGPLMALAACGQAGILPAVKPCLEAMRARGVWLSDRLMAAALAECEEG